MDKIFLVVDSTVRNYIENLTVRKDIIQDILLSVITAYDTKYTEQGHFVAWVAKIAKNVCIDYLRKCKRKELFLREYSYYRKMNDTNDADPYLVQKEILYRLMNTLAQEGAFSLDIRVQKDFFLESKTITRIASEENISRKRVKKILREPIKKLQDEFENEFDGSYQDVDEKNLK